MNLLHNRVIFELYLLYFHISSRLVVVEIKKSYILAALFAFAFLYRQNGETFINFYYFKNILRRLRNFYTLHISRKVFSFSCYIFLKISISKSKKSCPHAPTHRHQMFFSHTNRLQKQFFKKREN